MHLEVLDQSRRDLLPLFDPFRQAGFYLAGGTALALHYGHRDSLDFDFFTEQPFDTVALFGRALDAFSGHTVLRTQEARSTLGLLVDGSINISFFEYAAPLLRPVVYAGPIDLASIADIGCMKCSAITGRASWKVYVDLYFILNEVPLKELLALCAIKLPQLDRALVLRSLVYFDDVVDEPILFKNERIVQHEVVKDFLRKRVHGIY